MTFKASSIASSKPIRSKLAFSCPDSPVRSTKGEDEPTSALSVPAQTAVRIDGDRVTDGAEHRQIGITVGVKVAGTEINSLFISFTCFFK